MTVADTMRDKLSAAFAPAQLTVADESAKHHGHAGARPEGETHFRVAIVSPIFSGLSRIERQRRIYSVLVAEMSGPVHALSLTAQTPEEFSKSSSHGM